MKKHLKLLVIFSVLVVTFFSCKNNATSSSVVDEWTAVTGFQGLDGIWKGKTSIPLTFEEDVVLFEYDLSVTVEYPITVTTATGPEKGYSSEMIMSLPDNNSSQIDNSLLSILLQTLEFKFDEPMVEEKTETELKEEIESGELLMYVNQNKTKIRMEAYDSPYTDSHSTPNQNALFDIILEKQ